MAKCSESQQWLIELLVYWEGQVRPAQLMDYWQCTRPHASHLLGLYNVQFPAALDYDSGSKTYRTADRFERRGFSYNRVNSPCK